MKRPTLSLPKWRKVAFLRVFGLCAGLGLLAFFTRLGQNLDGLGFDLLTVLGPRPSATNLNVAVIGIDDESLRQLQSLDSGPLPRRHHAELVRRLAADQALGVVFDLFFDQPSPVPEDDTRFAQALREQGRCLLAAYESGFASERGQTRSVMAPIPLLREAARGWALSNLDPSPVVRRLWQIPSGSNSLAEVAYATFAQEATARSAPRPGQAWLRYLGPFESRVIPTYRFAEVTNLPAGTFAGKTVFVGRMAQVVSVTSPTSPDQFATPYHRLGKERTAGVLLHALTYVNLRDGLWLRRLGGVPEVLVLLGFAALLAAGTTLLSFRWGLVALLGIVGAGLAAAFLGFGAPRLWWGYLTPTLLQAPVALGAGWLMRTRRLAVESGAYDAFLSYRREDGAAVARLLRSELARRGYRAFLDVEDIGTVMFDQRILQTVASVPAVIVVLSPRCLDRCLDPSDWVRQEIRHAFLHSRVVVPVMLPDFRFPEAAQLPVELHPLLTLNSVKYSHEHFEATITGLLTALERRTNATRDL